MVRAMPNIFLSYANEDLDAAKKLYLQLSRIEGLNIWFDKKSLLPGQNWDLEIRKAIKEADCCIVLLSRHSTKRGYYQREIRMALDILREIPEGDIFLIPARLHAVPPHFADLKIIQYVDMFPVWFDGLRKLCAALNIPDKRLTTLVDLDIKLSCVLQWNGEKTTELTCSSSRKFTPTPAAYESYAVWDDASTNQLQFWKNRTIYEYPFRPGLGSIGRPSIWGDKIVWEQRIRGVPQRQIIMLNIDDDTLAILSNGGDNIGPSIFESTIAWCSSGNGGVFLLRNGQVTKLDNFGTCCSVYADKVAWQSKDGIFLFDGINRKKIAPSGSSFPSVFGDKVGYEFKGNIFVWNKEETLQITKNGNNYISYPWQRSLWGEQIVWRHSSEGSSHIFLSQNVLDTEKPTKISRFGINTDPSISEGNVVWSFKYNYESFREDQFREFAAQKNVVLSDLEPNQRLKLKNEFSELEDDLRDKFIRVMIERPWADVS